MLSFRIVDTAKLSASNLRQALRFAGISQAELARLMRANKEGLACSESYMSKLYNGLRPGSQYQAAINRALSKHNVQIDWTQRSGQNL